MTPLQRTTRRRRGAALLLVLAVLVIAVSSATLPVGTPVQVQFALFGAADLAVVTARYGSAVGAETERGTPALDVPATVAAACVAAGWPAPERPACTSGPGFFSHRTRGDRERQTTVAWLEVTP